MKILLVLLQALLLLSGAGTAEELDESELERYELLVFNPVCINLASANRLQTCGLFSAYQVASIQNYIRENGDILSATELATVPGFTPELAAAMKQFISFESYSASPSKHRHRLWQSFRIRDANGQIAGKYSLQYGEKMELYLSHKQNLSASLAVHGKRPWKLVAGDFNVRLGQGLLAWSGFSMSGVSTVGSFRRNASGVSPTGSFSPSHRGLAADYCGRIWKTGAALDSRGSLIAFGAWQGHSSAIGINCISGAGSTGFSADASLNAGHFFFFGEAAWCNAPAALVGAIWEPAYKTAFSLLARYYSPGYAAFSAGAVRSGSKVRDEAAISAGISWKWLDCTADMSVHPERIALRKSNYQQFKSVINASPSFVWNRWQFSPAVRWVERMQLSPSENGYNASWKHDFRTDLKASRGPLQGCLRLNALKNADSRTGGLAYLELGYKTASDTARFQVSVYLRGTVCDIPDWASRIYCYERDLPGCFTVPAWYGQKRSVSFITGLSFRTRKCRQRLYFRASTNDIKLQYQIWFW